MTTIVDEHRAVDCDLMTVGEAATALRISRSLAYNLARRYLATDGREGIPVVRFGTLLRVPRWALLELAHNGRIVLLGVD